MNFLVFFCDSFPEALSLPGKHRGKGGPFKRGVLFEMAKLRLINGFFDGCFLVSFRLKSLFDELLQRGFLRFPPAIGQLL